MKTIELAREAEYTAPPEALWPLLADTTRLNRLAGMSSIQAEPIDGEAGARVRVRTRLDGFPVVYDEEPFEWQAPSHFRVRRLMREGVLYALEFALVLGPGTNGGSKVRWILRLTPKFSFIAPVAWFFGSLRLANVLRATRTLDESVRPAARTEAPPPIADATRVAMNLERAVAEVDRPLARRLAQWVTTAPDEDLLHIRPFALADRWGEPRDRVLGVCLEAVVAGLLQMQWDIVCPSCRTGSSRVDHLYELDQAGHCNLCDIRFDLPLDRAVEAIFRPAPEVRQVVVGPFCTGGPAATPHVVAQAQLPADGEARLFAPANAGPLRVFVRGGATADVAVEDQGAQSATLQVTGDELVPKRVRVAPQGEIRVLQPGGVTRHVKLEKVAWADQAATAHILSLNPRFRRLFSGEVLGPGRQLRVARVALLFSDLSASTALYSRAGDASAFRLVQDHFDLVGGCIAAEGGVVVKTIGDAVMAAFPDEGGAVRAAVAMQAAWGGFRAARPLPVDTMLKLGVYAGPAYVVTANGMLDYFGQTVNIAARLQGAAHEGEIVVTDALAATAAEAGWLGPAQVTERFDAVLKGLDSPLRSARMAIPG